MSLRNLYTNLNFEHSSGILSGSSGVFLQDIHLENPISLSETEEATLRDEFSAISIVGALNELKDIGQSSVEGLSGLIDLDSPDESISIVANGQAIELTTPSGYAPSGASYILVDYNDNDHLTDARKFNATSGIVLDDQGARSISGIVVKLNFDDEPAVGEVLAWDGSKLRWDVAGGSGSPVDSRPVIDAIIPDASGVYPLGNFNLPFLRVAGVSGIFNDRIHLDAKRVDSLLPNLIGDIWLRSNKTQYETLAIVGESGTHGVRLDVGLFEHGISSDIVGITTFPTFTNITLPAGIPQVIDDDFYVVESSNNEVVLVLAGIYRITYLVNVKNTASTSGSIVARVTADDIEIAGRSYAFVDGHSSTSSSFLYEALLTHQRIKYQVAVFEGGISADVVVGTNINIEFLRPDLPVGGPKLP